MRQDRLPGRWKRIALADILDEWGLDGRLRTATEPTVARAAA
jgi:hypothetical protein